MEITLDRLGQGLHRGGFCEAWQAFDEQVAVAEQAHQHAFHETFLADHAGRDVPADRVQHVAVILVFLRCGPG